MTDISNADLRGEDIVGVDLREAWLREPDLENAHVRGADLTDTEIDGEIEGLTVNGVEVAPLIEAELDRRHPERAILHASTADEFRARWPALEAMWQQTLDRATAMPTETADVSIDGEWSFAQTLRHLVFATDVWPNDAILRRDRPYHRYGEPFSGWRDRAGEVGIEVGAHPPYQEVLAMRADRVQMVRDYLTSLTDDQLDQDRRPYFTTQSFPARQCLWIIANEEWNHHRYAVRDLEAIRARAGEFSG